MIIVGYLEINLNYHCHSLTVINVLTHEIIIFVIFFEVLIKIIFGKSSHRHITPARLKSLLTAELFFSFYFSSLSFFCLCNLLHHFGSSRFFIFNSPLLINRIENCKLFKGIFLNSIVNIYRKRVYASYYRFIIALDTRALRVK